MILVEEARKLAFLFAAGLANHATDWALGTGQTGASGLPEGLRAVSHPGLFRT